MDHWTDTSRTFKAGYLPELPLIHKTQEWEVFKLILQQGFRPSYCTESLTNNQREVRAAFPMISFTNVSVTESKHLLKSYGSFGIALNKNWGEQYKLNPVLYLERNSDITNDTINSFDSLKKYSAGEINSAIRGSIISEKHFFLRNLIKLFAYSKNYDSALIRGEESLSEKYFFGLEREWRLVLMHEDAPYFLTGEEVNDKSKFNKIIENERFNFELADINKIIVEDEWQIESAKEILSKKYKTEDFPHDLFLINSIRHVPDE